MGSNPSDRLLDPNACKEFWDEVIRVNKEAFIKRETERFYRERFLPFWKSLPWHVRLLVRCYARLRR